MKRIIALALLAMMVFGASAANAATTFKASGAMDFAWGWTDNTDFTADDGEDDFTAEQRFRFNASFIQDEYLAGYANFELGDIVWGEQGTTGQFDSNGNNPLEVRHMYLDWYVPNTDLMFRMGKFAVDLQAAVAGSPILDATTMGILASYKVNDNVSVLGLWSRIADTQTSDLVGNVNDEADAFAVLVPLHFDGISATPFFMYAMAGAGTGLDIAGSGVATDGSTAWYAGSSLTVNMFDPIVFKADVNYGSATDSMLVGDDFDAHGWFFAGKLSYTTEYATPGIIAWYATGEDDENDESERMPIINGDAGSFFAADMAFDGGNTRTGGTAILGESGVGTWGLGLVIEDISFMEGLTHDARFIYVRGTNDKDSGLIALGDLTEDDSVFEIDFNSKYMIYDNLALLLDAAVLMPNYDEDRVGDDTFDETAYRVSVGLSYSF